VARHGRRKQGECQIIKQTKLNTRFKLFPFDLELSNVSREAPRGAIGFDERREGDVEFLVYVARKWATDVQQVLRKANRLNAKQRQFVLSLSAGQLPRRAQAEGGDIRLGQGENQRSRFARGNVAVSLANCRE
jgi:hypothetical protein